MRERPKKVAFSSLRGGDMFRFGVGGEFAINVRVMSATPRFLTLTTGILHDCQPDKLVVPVAAYVEVA